MAISVTGTTGGTLAVATGIFMAAALGLVPIAHGGAHPPTLAVSPSTVGAPGDVSSTSATCPFSSSQHVWTCSITLSETLSSKGSAAWSASTTANATFTPAHGTLKPGSSVTVTVVVGSCGGQYPFDFDGPHNTATVVFSCG